MDTPDGTQKVYILELAEFSGPDDTKTWFIEAVYASEDYAMEKLELHKTLRWYQRGRITPYIVVHKFP